LEGCGVVRYRLPAHQFSPPAVGGNASLELK
jgi:hypothetical protein